MATIEKIRAEIERRKEQAKQHYDQAYSIGRCDAFSEMLNFIDALEESEKPMQEELDIEYVRKDKSCPDSTELIAMWKETKAMLEEQDYRSNSWRLAYNAFLEGFAKGITY